MTDEQARAPFREFPGVEDWRVLFTGPHARYRCAGLVEASRFASAIAEVAAPTGISPDLDLRSQSVTVRITFRESDRIAPAQLALAQAISAVASDMSLVAEPDRLQVVQLWVAHAADVDVRPFWSAALGYEPLGDSDAVDPDRRDPGLSFGRIRGGLPGRGRTHVDVSVPADVAPARVRAALAAGGRMVDDSHAPDWWTIASPDNHGVDIAGWADDHDGWESVSD